MEVSQKVPEEVKGMMFLDNNNLYMKDFDVEESKYYFVTTEDDPHSISGVLEVTSIIGDVGNDIQAFGSLLNLEDGGYDTDCKKDFSKKQIRGEVSRGFYSTIIEFFKRRLDESKRNKDNDDEVLVSQEILSERPEK